MGGLLGSRRYRRLRRRRVGLRLPPLLVQRARVLGVPTTGVARSLARGGPLARERLVLLALVPHQVHVDDDSRLRRLLGRFGPPAAAEERVQLPLLLLLVILLSRAPAPRLGLAPVARQAWTGPRPLLLQPVHHVLDGLELAGRRAGYAGRRGRGRARGRPRRRRPRAEGAPAPGRHRLEGRAVGGRVVRGQRVGREPMSLQLVQWRRQGVGVVSEECGVLGGGKGQLGVEEHAGGDAAVEA